MLSLPSEPPDPAHARLLRELRKCAGWEDLSGAIAAAERLAALPGEEVPAALVRELVGLDAVDLSEDAGDIADELYRARAALEAGLIRCGPRAVSWLRPVLAGAPDAAARVALRVLAALGDAAALPVARRWLAEDSTEEHAFRLAAIEALGLLRPADAVALLRGVLVQPHAQNGGWVKRIAAHALGRLGDVATLDRLLDDPDWFARLGAAEALANLPAGQGEAARRRASRDPDPRVAQAAKRA